MNFIYLFIYFLVGQYLNILEEERQIYIYIYKRENLNFFILFFSKFFLGGGWGNGPPAPTWVRPCIYIKVMHTQTCTGTPRKPSEWRLKIVREKKLMNIAQKMLKFQAETSLFLMMKTKH